MVGVERTYMGTSPMRKPQPLRLYRRPMPRVLGGSWGGGKFSYGRGTPVTDLKGVGQHEMKQPAGHDVREVLIETTQTADPRLQTLNSTGVPR